MLTTQEYCVSRNITRAESSADPTKQTGIKKANPHLSTLGDGDLRYLKCNLLITLIN
jgi:hypothetical protein